MIDAFRAITGNAPRMLSNRALMAVTAPAIGRRCSASTLWSAPPSGILGTGTH
jgi:hypothetical protein